MVFLGLLAISFVGTVTALFLAQGGSEVTSWERLGVLGLIVLGFVTGQIVPGWIHKQTQKEKDEERERNLVLEKEMRETMVPALKEATESNKLATNTIKELTTERTLEARQKERRK